MRLRSFVAAAALIAVAGSAAAAERYWIAYCESTDGTSHFAHLSRTVWQHADAPGYRAHVREQALAALGHHEETADLGCSAVAFRAPELAAYAQRKVVAAYALTDVRVEFFAFPPFRQAWEGPSAPPPQVTRVSETLPTAGDAELAAGPAPQRRAP